MPIDAELKNPKEHEHRPIIDTAIAAAVEGDEYVITTATTLIKAGDQVRLSNE